MQGGRAEAGAEYQTDNGGMLDMAFGHGGGGGCGDGQGGQGDGGGGVAAICGPERTARGTAAKALIIPLRADGCQLLRRERQEA